MVNVIGLGNLLKGDDAVGPTVIELLLGSDNQGELNLVDAGADAIMVLDYLLADNPVIIIDCAKMGKMAGDVVAFDVNSANISHVSTAFSIHGYSFAEIYTMAVAIGPVAPCRIIGVEPKQINFNTDLSEEVKASIPKIINMVKMEAQNYAQEDIDY